MVAKKKLPPIRALIGRSSRKEIRNRSYRKRRAELIAYLGGVCVQCGEPDAEKLEFNHLRPRTWTARKHNRWTRVAKYWTEAMAGDIDLRCKDCNKKAGKPAATNLSFNDVEIPA